MYPEAPRLDTDRPCQYLRHLPCRRNKPPPCYLCLLGEPPVLVGLCSPHPLPSSALYHSRLSVLALLPSVPAEPHWLAECRCADTWAAHQVLTCLDTPFALGGERCSTLRWCEYKALLHRHTRTHSACTLYWCCPILCGSSFGYSWVLRVDDLQAQRPYTSRIGALAGYWSAQHTSPASSQPWQS